MAFANNFTINRAALNEVVWIDPPAKDQLRKQPD
jgi:hypothetical protein